MNDRHIRFHDTQFGGPITKSTNVTSWSLEIIPSIRFCGLLIAKTEDECGAPRSGIKEYCRKWGSEAVLSPRLQATPGFLGGPPGGFSRILWEGN